MFHIIIPSFALLFGFHAHKQIIFLQYKRSNPIVKNDGDSQERMLQNTLILRGQEAVRIMLKGFLCLTQPAFTRRPWRGNALPRRRVGALLCFDIILTDSRPLREYSCAITPQVRQAGNRLSGLTETAYASLLA